jgi:hypothetical protein
VVGYSRARTDFVLESCDRAVGDGPVAWLQQFNRNAERTDIVGNSDANTDPCAAGDADANTAERAGFDHRSGLQSL